MDSADRLAVYAAQCANVHALEIARRQLRRSTNDALRTGNSVSADVHTKSLALVFCAWVEASFSKTIHTPKGFSLAEIAQIKAAIRDGSVVDGWERCIQLAFLKSAAKKSNFTANAKQRLRILIDLYVKDPSLIRNKVAHGQWKHALNRGNTKINSQITGSLQSLDLIKIELWFDCQKILCEIIELLIESPNRAFMASYWGMIERVEQIPVDRATWTMSSKRSRLKPKRAPSFS
ncbi:hypothetical protein [Rhizobium sp. LC145]|uniref:hypothetical protein n=1 Tax=Rhizobium sp. LC145 TaxID=1120688 RepID=UPI00062A476E|nr:hypothetical protein [Rhizobium sp. LC145]KKX26706.1 hypothetical protein YH62_23780 [Rhizobium sp. LC145]